MTFSAQRAAATLSFLIAITSGSACKDRNKPSSAADIPELNEQIQPFITVETAKVYAGAGAQFGTISEIKPNSKVQVAGRDGEWLLVVSTKGNPPGFIHIATVRPATSEDLESQVKSVAGQFETLADIQLRSGPADHYPVVAEIKKGTKINVVNEESGWLRVESKHGNAPGYIEAKLARPAKNR
jgi:uncharacterized protein YraI